MIKPAKSASELETAARIARVESMLVLQQSRLALRHCREVLRKSLRDFEACQHANSTDRETEPNASSRQSAPPADRSPGRGKPR